MAPRTPRKPANPNGRGGRTGGRSPRTGKDTEHVKVVKLSPKEVRELVKRFGAELVAFEVIASPRSPGRRAMKAPKQGPQSREETDSSSEEKTRMIVMVGPSRPGTE